MLMAAADAEASGARKEQRMSLDLAEAHAHALDSARRSIAGVGAEQWDAPSTCEGWTVRELVSHIVGGNYWAAELTAGLTIEEVGDRLDGDLLGTDPMRAFDDSAIVSAAAFRAPGAMETMCAVSYGPVPGEIYCGHRLIDVLVHGWDVAVSTGQDATLDAALVDAALEVVEPQIDLIAASGQYGTRQPVADDAGPQSRLLALLGRTG
jgi:uncharacterized protein (TIGR03086 family)